MAGAYSDPRAGADDTCKSLISKAPARRQAVARRMQLPARKTATDMEEMMSAMRKVTVTEHREEAGRRFSRELHVVPTAAPTGRAEAAAPAPSLAKNMALFLVSPFVGLVYAVLLPFVGAAMLAWVVGKALCARPTLRRAVRWGGYAAKVAAAPFVGLAYLVLFPFVGAALLLWIGVSEAGAGRRAPMPC